MKTHLLYLKAVLRHKWFVLLAGLPMMRGLPPKLALRLLLNLIIHDASKFSASEWGPYARAFYGSAERKTGKPDGNVAFDRAWLHHLRHNKHHWQAWVYINTYSTAMYRHPAHTRAIDLGWLLQDDGRHKSILTGIPMGPLNYSRLEVEPMPSPYLEEMIADWRGANRAYGDQSLVAWYEKTRAARILHPDTQRWVEEELGVGYTGPSRLGGIGDIGV